MLCFPGTSLLAQAITVVSWGGSYARASQEGYHKPFTEETGIEIRLEDYYPDMLSECGIGLLF